MVNCKNYYSIFIFCLNPKFIKFRVLQFFHKIGVNNFDFFHNHHKLKEFVRNPFPLFINEVQAVLCDINFSHNAKVTNSLHIVKFYFGVFVSTVFWHEAQRSWYSHSSGFAGFVTIHRDKRPSGAVNPKLPPSPAIVGYTMLCAGFNYFSNFQFLLLSYNQSLAMQYWYRLQH